jgi:protein KIBRA
VKWYNVLSFHFMQPEVKRPVSASPRAHHLKQESEISSMNSSRQGTLKEESSDESTIISSQTSTLTRNIGPESMLTQAEYTVDGGIPFQLGEDESDEDEENDEDEFVINENTDSFVFPLASPAVDAETNTECVFIQQPQIGRKSSLPASTTAISSSVKRSKTFSPSAPINKTEYNCRLNRSDSDSAMPLYRRLPFQRTSKERRSLHVPTKAQPRPGRLPVPDLPNTKTSIDLELDLAAQQSKLTVLNEEIDRLRQIKSKMEEAKDKGGSELPAWFHEDEKFQALLASLEFKKGQKSLEEKRIEKLLKKHAKEIYKLRKTKSIKGQLDVQSFKEKMAFFTSVKAHVPILGGDESEEDSGSEATLRLVNSGLSSCLATPRLNEEDKQDGDEEEEEGLKEGLSTETVNTITGEEETSSQNSTPTPNLQSERFSYDVDPELGAFV